MSSPAAAQPKGWFRLGRGAGILLVLVGIVLLVLPLGSSTHSSPGRDGAYVIAFWIPGLLLITLGTVLNRILLRLRTVVILTVALAGIWLMHPVCDRIANADVPRFETVITLEQRARQGEPFRKLEGHWYQCKSWISRQFFF
ncbi:MAG TPA: hypothetical protein VJ756_21140 [Terriglobales bacterium]|nr:hypothetical protein [Terriglobales bacterium]